MEPFLQSSCLPQHECLDKAYTERVKNASDWRRNDFNVPSYQFLSLSQHKVLCFLSGLPPPSPRFFGAADNEGLEFALFHLSLPQLHLTMQLQSSASFVWLRNFFCGMSDLRRQLFALFSSTGSLFSIKFRKDDKLGSLLSFGKPLSPLSPRFFTDN